MSKTSLKSSKKGADASEAFLFNFGFWSFEFVSDFDIRISDLKHLYYFPQSDHVKLPKLDTKLLKQDTSTTK
jgi:hypothetical protein